MVFIIIPDIELLEASHSIITEATDCVKMNRQIEKDFVVSGTLVGDSGKSRLLYVEDELELRNLFGTVMTEKGFVADLAETGAQALDMCRGTPYDIVVVDYMLSDTTGLDIARELLGDERKLDVVFITGKGSEKVASEALNLGVLHYVVKDGERTYTEWLPRIINHLDEVRQARSERKALNQKVRNDEARRQAFTSNAPEALFVKNLDGTYQFVNSVFEKNYKVSADEIIGKTSAVIFPPHLVAQDEHQDAIVLKQGDVSKIELSFDGDNGEPRYLLVRKFPIRNGAGEITSLGGIHVDITVQRESHRALARTAAIFNGSADGIILISAEGIIETLNPAAEQVFGYSADEIVGQDVSCLLPEDERTAHKGYIAKAELHMPRIIHKTRDLLGRRKDGQFFPMELNVAPVSTDGVDSHIVGVFRDITEKKAIEAELREKEERYRFFVENIQEGVVVVENRKVVDVSRVWLDMFRYERDEVIGRDVLDFTAPSKHDLVRTKVATESSEPYESELMRNHGVIFPALVRGKTLNHGGRKVRITTVMDITGQKNYEAALIEAKLEADHANAAKSEFLSSMSHELRTPMNSIMGFSQMLEANPNEPLTDAQKKCVDHILHGGKHLLELINEVLDLSTIESGHMSMSIEEVTIGDVIGECLPLISSAADARNITVHVPKQGASDISVQADYTRLKQALLNLLSNAVKYNREGGSVTLSILRDADLIRLSVSDTGHGIAKDQQKELFQPFSRLGAEASEIEGTGIGLSITRKIVQLLGGEIGFRSKPGAGSTFWIELPASEKLSLDNETPLRAAESPDDEEALSGRVLYVEDNSANLQLMAMLIDRYNGLELLSATTAEAGLEIAERDHPDLIILDINLPEMDGFEVLSLLKKRKKTQAIPVVALSANAMEGDIRRGLEAGFLRYLTKPINMDEVIDTISKMLNAEAAKTHAGPVK